ncbi:MULTISPECIES: hypothetical protein [unclassified Streptomyces]|uniref:hypothetical protein n=1 Tax=unclassified Streptomyces TaxID=2593676 RepID=UPI002E18D50B|nr:MULTISPECIES: hypothetical protein [unclassified Streptomyces]
MVETVIRELIEWALITLAASAAFAALTAGISAAAGTAAAAAEGSLAATRIASLVARLARALQKISKAMQGLKRAAKANRFSPMKPATWKELKTAEGLKNFAAKKVVKTTGKAALGAVGLTGDPVGQTAQEGATGAAGIAADEADDRLSGNRNPSTAAREDTGAANPSDADHQTVEPRFRDNPFG